MSPLPRSRPVGRQGGNMTEEEERTDESVDAARTFTFESGTTVTIKRINNLFVGKVSLAAEEKWQAENGEIVCPTYAVKVAGGGEEVHDHNETTIATEPWSEDEEAQAAWKKYQSDSLALQGARIEATAKVCLKEGVVTEPTDAWRERCKYYGLEIPDHPKDELWEFLYDCSTGWTELIELAWAIQMLPAPEEEAADVAENLFPDPLGSSRDGTGSETDQEEAE